MNEHIENESNFVDTNFHIIEECNEDDLIEVDPQDTDDEYIMPPVVKIRRQKPKIIRKKSSFVKKEKKKTRPTRVTLKRYGQKIRQEWFYDQRLKDWLIMSPDTPNQLHCKLCHNNLTPKLYVLLKHIESRSHTFNASSETDREYNQNNNRKSKIKQISQPQPESSPIKSSKTNTMFLKFETDICRVCLKSEGTISLFGNENSVDGFRFITFLEASENDGLPQSLCIKCNARLKVAYNFKTQAISSETQLKNYLKDINRSFLQITKSSSADEHDELIKDIEELNALMDPEDKIEINHFRTNESTTNQKTSSSTTYNIDSKGLDIDFQVLFGDENEIEQPQFLDIANTSSDPLKVITKNNKKRTIRTESAVVYDGDFHCSICNKQFSTNSNLNRHKLIQHERDKHALFYCEICGKAFTVNGSLKQHLTIHTGEKPFECNICHKKFRRKNTMNQHKKTHIPEKPWSCKVCKESFSTKNSLLIHIRAHNLNSILHKCNTCNEKFIAKVDLVNHIENEHEQKIEIIAATQCNDNNAYFLINKDLDVEHIMDDNNMEIIQQKFECTDCPLIFDNKMKYIHHLKDHENIHENLRGFECRKCNSSFENVETLFDHLKVHMKKYKCIYCTEFLLSKNILKLHVMKRHSELFKEMNVCNLCDLTFITFDSYYEHYTSLHII